jgi:hypothetical protein
VKPITALAFLALFLISLLSLTGCAPAEEDADSIADTTIKGLSGQGKLTTEKPLKDGFGENYQ